MTARLNKPHKGHRTEPPASRFSRKWFAQTLRTGAWAAVITILVWVYADIHFTDEDNVMATLRIHTGSADNIVLLSRPDVPITFRIKGNRNFIVRFLDHLSTEKSVLKYDAARALDAGQHRERIAEILAGLPEFRDSGLEIVWARPRDIDIHLDELEDVRGVPVQFAHTGAVLAEDAKIEPARIDIRVPASRRQSIDPQTLTLSTRTVDLSGEAVGKTKTVEVEVLPPPNLDHVSLTPDKVTVTFKVGQQTGSRKFAVTVAVQSPRAWLMDNTWSQYRLQAKPPENWTRQITVAGNRIDLEKLSADKIRAYIVLTDEDKKRKIESWWPGKVKVRFPAGLNVRLAEPVGDLLYRLVKRSEPPAPPP